MTNVEILIAEAFGYCFEGKL